MMEAGQQSEARQKLDELLALKTPMPASARNRFLAERMKLARNMLTFTSYAAAGEAMKLADAAGLDLQALGRVVRHTDALTGGPGAVMIRDNLDDLEPGHWLYDIFVHTRGLGEKDLGLALGLGDSLGVELPLAELAVSALAARLGVPHRTE